MIARITQILTVCAVSIAAAEEVPSCDGSVSGSELAQITSVIREVASEPIEHFGRCRDGTVSIWVGHRGGQIFRLRKDDEKWKIVNRVFYVE